MEQRFAGLFPSHFLSCPKNSKTAWSYDLSMLWVLICSISWDFTKHCIYHLLYFLAPLLLAASGAYSVVDWRRYECLSVVKLCSNRYCTPLAVFLWFSWNLAQSMCLCANVQKTVEISKVLLYKFLANFSNFTLGFSLWNSLNNSVSQN